MSHPSAGVIHKGSYSIKVKARDIYGGVSGLSDPLPITMPYLYNLMLQFLERLFQRYPNAFPLQRQLMGYEETSLFFSLIILVKTVSMLDQ
jgi:hypothetical protein